MKEAHVVVRIEPEKLDKLKRLAEKQDRSVSWMIRKAIDRLLEEQKHAR
jgi:predicted transcriptional regulator